MVTLITGAQGSGKSSLATTLTPEGFHTEVHPYDTLGDVINAIPRYEPDRRIAYIFDEIPAKTYRNDTFCAFMAGLSMFDDPRRRVYLISQHEPDAITSRNITHVRCFTKPSLLNGETLYCTEMVEH